MTAHSSGSGSSWNETLDVDQPHGLDYQETNDDRIGVRKRMAQEHATFADNTVGGVHKPGGSAVLGIHDGTPPAADGTALRGHGLIWDNTARLWCSTAVAGASTSGDPTLLFLHPDKQWAGGDITWTGAQQYDNSVEFLDPVDFTGPVIVEGSCDFSDVAITGDISIAGKFAIDGSADFSDVFIEGDVSVKGVLKVDGTATQFGGTQGTALFFDPTSYSDVESASFPQGMIMKRGIGSGAQGDTDISFASAFPGGILNVQLTPQSDVDAGHTLTIYTKGSIAATGFTYDQPNGGAAFTSVHWFAIGF